MSASQIGELAQPVQVFGERDSLAGALEELWKGRPALVLVDGEPHFVHPADAIGHQETRRLVDLPLVRAHAIPYDTPLWRALVQTRESDFILVSRGKNAYAIASRQALLEELLGGSDPKERANALTVIEVLDQSPEGVVVLDTRRQVHGLNAAARRMLALVGGAEPGQPIETLGGVPIDTLLDDARQGLPRDLTVEEPSPRVISVRTLRSAQQADADTVFLLRDVTHVRHRQAREAAQERMALLGALSSGIAHDLNNVLTVVGGCASLMAPDEPADEFALEGIRTAVDRASALVRQLLAYARKELTEPATLSLPVLVGGIEVILRRLAGPGVELAVELDEDTPPVCADPVQVERILTNLVVNAHNAMPRGGRLELAVRRHEDCTHLGKPKAGSPVLAASIRVRDTGEGMGPATLAHVFEPYFTTDPVRGTGLGLATVHATVAALHGHVRVSSAPGAGTTFDICLPAVPGERVRPAPVEAKPQRRARPSGALLVAERDPLVAAVIRKVLESAGYTVTVFGTADAAIEWARGAGEPDLLIADVDLASLPGELRTRYPQLRVLLMSGVAHDELLEQSQHPLVDYVAKPFTGDALLARVEELVGSPDEP